MKCANRFTIFILLIALIAKGGLVYSQNFRWDISDTGKCYIKEVYKKSQIKLEKRWQSNEITFSPQVPLIADMDGDCFPEIVVGGINSLEDKIVDTFKVHYFDFRNGKLKHKFDCFDWGDLDIKSVIIDIDNDGVKEIIYSSYSGTPFPAGILLCYDFYGKLIWRSDKYFYLNGYDPGAPNFGVADFNQDGYPKVYCNNRIFNTNLGIRLVDVGASRVGSYGSSTHLDVSDIVISCDRDSITINGLEYSADLMELSQVKLYYTLEMKN